MSQIQKTSLCFIQDRYLGCLLASSNHGLEQIHGYKHSFFFFMLQGGGPSSDQLQSWIQHFLQQLYLPFLELLLILVITFPSLCHHHLPHAFDSADRTLKNLVLFPITVNILFKVITIYLLSPINYSARNIHSSFPTVLLLPSDYCIWPFLLLHFSRDQSILIKHSYLSNCFVFPFCLLFILVWKRLLLCLLSLQ